MSRSSIWFGDDENPIAGWLHLPDQGVARAGVVLCPTLGVEALVAQPVYRLLAIKLEEAGFAVIRFDYPATGDSAGLLENDASVEIWLNATASAIELIRSCGVHEVGLVGLRIGGTLAGVAASLDGDVDALVLWDPCATGQRFIREQLALKALSLGDIETIDESDDVELLSMRLPGALARELRGLAIGPRDTPYARRTLLIARADRPPASNLDDWLGKDSVDRRETAEQAEFIDVEPGLSVFPIETIGEIVGWLSKTLATTYEPVHFVGAQSAVVAASSDSGEITERGVTFGPSGLFGIVTEPAIDRDYPSVVLLNVGLFHHVGTGRMWVELARHWADQGLRVIRFDLAGIGESPAHEGRPERVSHPLDAVLDIEEAARLMSPQDPHDVVLVGISSGAYHAIETGISFGVAGVGLINPFLYFDPPEVNEGEPIAQNRVAVQPVHGVVRWMRSSPAVVRIAQWAPIRNARESPTLARIVNDSTPEVFWQVLDKLDLVRSGARTLEALADKGTDILLVCGEQEARTFQRSRSRVQALSATGRLRLEVPENLDHSLFSSHSRAAVTELLEGFVPGRFAAGSSHGSPASQGPSSTVDLDGSSGASRRIEVEEIEPPTSSLQDPEAQGEPSTIPTDPPDEPGDPASMTTLNDDEAALRRDPSQSRLGTVGFRVGVGLVIESLGYATARDGHFNRGLILFLIGVAVIFGSCAWRLLGVHARRLERLRVSVVLGVALIVSTYLASPLIYDYTFDSVLHQTTYWQLADLRELFSRNTTLPISPHYPGLEMLTVAIKWGTGLPTVLSQFVVLVLARLVLIAVIFLLCERVTHSGRAASFAVIIYTCSPLFYLYNSAYNYQSLALAFGAGAVYFLYLAVDGLHPKRNAVLSVMAVAGVTVTHHLTGWLTVILIVCWAVMMKREAKHNPEREADARIAQNVAIASVVISLAWTAPSGSLLYSYLYPIFSEAWDALIGLLTGATKHRTLFHLNGIATPRWQEALVIISVLVSIFVVVFSTWAAIFRDSMGNRLQRFLPIVVSLGYVVVLTAPLTGASGFVGERISTFVFFGIAFVAGAWSLAWKKNPHPVFLTGLATVCFLGSLIFGSGPSLSYLQGPYLPVGDQRSFNSPTIAAVNWAAANLPVNSVIATDRDNSVIFAAYAHLSPLTSSGNNTNAGYIFFTPFFGTYETGFVRQYDVRYIVVDRRLLDGPPTFGQYFDLGSPPPGVANRLTATELNKFANDPSLQQIYDNGSIQIFDTAKVLDTHAPATTVAPIGSGGSGVNLWVLIPSVLMAAAWLFRAWKRRFVPRLEEVLAGLVAAMVVAIAAMFAFIPTGLDSTPFTCVLVCGLLFTFVWDIRHLPHRSSDVQPIGIDARTISVGATRRQWDAERWLAIAGGIACAVALAISVASAQTYMSTVTALSISPAGTRPVLADVTLASATSHARLEIQRSGHVVWTTTLHDQTNQQVRLPLSSISHTGNVVLLVDGKSVREVRELAPFTISHASHPVSLHLYHSDREIDT